MGSASWSAMSLRRCGHTPSGSAALPGRSLLSSALTPPGVKPRGAVVTLLLLLLVLPLLRATSKSTANDTAAVTGTVQGGTSTVASHANIGNKVAAADFSTGGGSTICAAAHKGSEGNAVAIAAITTWICAAAAPSNGGVVIATAAAFEGSGVSDVPVVGTVDETLREKEGDAIPTEAGEMSATVS